MDEYGQVGPEKGEWLGDCGDLAKVLQRHGAAFAVLAHRGTRQEVALQLASRLEVHGAEPAGIALDDQPPWALLSVVGRGACWVQLGDGFMHAGYLETHLSAADFNSVDAESLVLLLDGVSRALGYGVPVPCRG